MTWQLTLGYIFFLVLVLWFAFVIANYATHKRFWTHRRYQLLLVVVPLGSEVQPFAAKHTLSEMGATVELLESVAAHHMPFALEAAVHHVGEEIHFYLYIPRRYKNEIVRDAKRIFPGARVVSDDYDPWMEGGEVEVMSLRQAKPALVPLKGAVSPAHDAFATVLRKMSHLKVLGEGAVIQFVIRPLSSVRRTEYVRAIQSLKTGAARSFKTLDEGFLATPETISVLESKLDSPLFAVNGRVLVAHQNKSEAKRIAKELGGSFEGVGAVGIYNEVYAVSAAKPARTVAYFSRRAFDEKEEMILNAQELATLFHLPTRHSSNPKTHRG